jgi:hypothetical protein
MSTKEKKALMRLIDAANNILLNLRDTDLSENEETGEEYPDVTELDAAIEEARKTLIGQQIKNPLYKTNIVIWSEFDPTKVELEDLARSATSGEAYCSQMQADWVENPENDADWDGTEFFDSPTDDDSEKGE